jgi:hypothetical protein
MAMLIFCVISSETLNYIGLATFLIAGLIVGWIAWNAWEEAHEVIEPAETDELMEAFEQARAEGELDDQEFKRIKGMLAETRGGRDLPDRK